ncbi:MAG: chromate transporter [Geminicoccaceae bacterium]
MNEPPAPRVSSWMLATTFNRIAIASFGGGLSAWSRQVVVEERGWLTEAEFVSALTVCRLLPGANQVNLAIFVGTRLGGVRGAVAAVTGLLCVPVLLVLGLAWLYGRYHQLPALQAVLRGMTAAAVALTFSMVYKTGRTCLTSLPAWLLMLASFAVVGIFRLPLIVAVAGLAPIALWWAWPRRVAP